MTNQSAGTDKCAAIYERPITYVYGAEDLVVEDDWRRQRDLYAVEIVRLVDQTLIGCSVAEWEEQFGFGKRRNEEIIVNAKQEA